MSVYLSPVFPHGENLAEKLQIHIFFINYYLLFIE